MIDKQGYRANVGIVITNDKQQVLLAKRYKQDSWQLPQGGIDKGESDLEALFRELNEEHKDVMDGQTDGSVTISLRNFVGEGIKSSSNDNSLNRKPLYEKYILISLYHVYVDNSKIVKYNFGSLN